MNTQQANILIIDDNADTTISLARALKARGLEFPTQAAGSAQVGLDFVKKYSPEVVVLDLVIDESVGPESGFTLLTEILRYDSTIRVIILTGHGSIEFGVKALQLGAASFLEKPPEITHLIELIHDGIRQCKMHRQYAKLVRQNEVLVDRQLVGSSQATKRLRENLCRLAETNQSVFIEGETGTGKSLCALLIHQLSPRAQHKFVRYQPVFGSSDLVNSELFGHKKGSFTGATNDRAGLILESNGGTLFLDEINELPHETQVALLNLLQERVFRAVGSDKECSADFRLISASNAIISECLDSGKLRRDLYHRIAHTKLILPSLRERSEDIPELSKHILSTLCSKANLNVFECDKPALARLLQHSWPGNIRELQGVIESAAYNASFSGRSFIAPEDLGWATHQPLSTSPQSDFKTLVESYKYEVVVRSLNEANGNQALAAYNLKMDRSSFRRILNRNQVSNENSEQRFKK